MEPIEVNAGAWYLRTLRADDRIDDRPALASAGIDDPDYVARRVRQWADDTRYSWAVCEPTTAELLAEVILVPGADGTAELTGWARPGHDEPLETGIAAVRRFAEGGLGLTVRG